MHIELLIFFLLKLFELKLTLSVFERILSVLIILEPQSSVCNIFLDILLILFTDE